MKIIILAAGKGTRLYPLTKDIPKCLVNISANLTLLEAQLNAIQHVSPSEVVIVTGYRSKQIEDVVGDWISTGKYSSLKLSIEFNPFFDVSNNLASLYMARRHFDEDFIVINGDDIFHRSVIEGLAQNEGDNIWMTISRKEEYEWEDMKVITVDDRVLRVGKKIPLEEANAESIGMILFRGKARKQFSDLLFEYMHEPEALNVFWLAAVQRAIDKGIRVIPYEIDDRLWAEMDFHPDLRIIRETLEQFVFSKKDIIGD